MVSEKKKTENDCLIAKSERIIARSGEGDGSLVCVVSEEEIN